MYCIRLCIVPISGFLLIENVELHHAWTCVALDFLLKKIFFGKQCIYVASLQCGSACDAVECLICENFLWHSGHSCGFSPVWVSMWRCRLHNSKNFLWHSEHSCGFSPVWVSMWLCRLLNSKNFLWHSEHSCFIPVWVSMWLRRVLNFKISCGIQSIHAVSFQYGSACDNAECIVVKTSCGIQSIRAVSLQYGSACDAVDCTTAKSFCDIQSIHVVFLQCGSACVAVDYLDDWIFFYNTCTDVW